MSGYHSPKEQNYKLEITRDVSISLHTDKEKRNILTKKLWSWSCKRLGLY